MTDTIFKLTGTDEIEPPLRLLRAGLLTATLDGGSLRWVKWRGVEFLRGLGFLVRNAGWGTPAITLTDLDVVEHQDSFSIGFHGSVRDGDARLDIRVTMEGLASGALSARAEVMPRTDFVTNRTGFVVLHPIEGFAGNAVTVDHSDGSVEQRDVPALVSPAQPVRDILGLLYTPLPGLDVSFRFEGEVFEMEDQRNWTDASFKTYSRPLDRPRPYALQAGIPITQAVTVAIHDDARSEPMGEGEEGLVTVRIGPVTAFALPRIGLALPSEIAAEALPHADILARAGVDHVVVRYDLSDPARGTLAEVARLAAAVDLPVTFDILLTAEEDPRPEIEAVAKEAGSAGLRPTAVGAYPKIDERSFQPGEPRPPSPGFAAIHAAIRAAFPGALVVGGSPAFFTELNRKQPDVTDLDVVTHGTCAIVHAPDDRSVMETLESLPWLIRSTRAFGRDRRLRIGPVAIGARINPYGSGPEGNAHNGRIGLTQLDPRQRGLFAAAWHVGYAAAIAPHAVDSLVLCAPVGPFGLIHTRRSHPQPPFDDADDGVVYPLFHAVADLARGGGKPVVETASSDPKRIAALAWHAPEGPTVILANLTAMLQTVELDGFPAQGSIRLLDTEHFDRAANEPTGFFVDGEAWAGPTMVLGPYAVATLTSGRAAKV